MSGVDYEEYIESEDWRQRAKEAKARAGNRCQVCNSPGRLDAHHRTYRRLGNEEPEDITVLCRRCHKKFHDLLPEPRERRRSTREPASSAIHMAPTVLLAFFVSDPSLVQRAVESGLRPHHFPPESVDKELFGSLCQSGGIAGEAFAVENGPSDEALEKQRELEGEIEGIRRPEEVFQSALRKVLYGPELRRLDEIDTELARAGEGRARGLLEEKGAIATKLRECGVPLSALRRFI